MSIKLNGDQMVIVQGLMEYAQAFCDQVMHIMKNHGLDKVDGCNLQLYVDPKPSLVQKSITIGEEISKDFGRIKMTIGENETKYTPLGTNSAEYELLFADESIKEAMAKALNKHNEKPLPTDGLWVGRDYGEE